MLRDERRCKLPRSIGETCFHTCFLLLTSTRESWNLPTLVTTTLPFPVLMAGFDVEPARSGGDGRDVPVLDRPRDLERC